MHQSLAASLALSAVLALASVPAAAQVELNPSHPETYTVRSGDTLWDIAGRFLQDPWRWRQIWDANQGRGNPNLIFPGDVLKLYYRDGQPRVGMQTGGHSNRQPVSVIPIDAIGPFLTRSYVLGKTALDRAPYIVSFPGERIVAGAGDYAYVRSISGRSGERFNIVRAGDAYRDPDSGNILGYEARFIADAVLERAGDPAKVLISSMELEVGIGDRVLPGENEKPLTGFTPRSGPVEARGRIISVLDGVSQIGRYDVVVIDVGTSDSVRPGDVFEVFNGGERVRDTAGIDEFRSDWKNQRFWSEETWFGNHRTNGWVPDGVPGPDFPPHTRASAGTGSAILPFERAGALMVFRAFDDLSFALIMSASRPMFLLDAVRAPPN